MQIVLMSRKRINSSVVVFLSLSLVLCEQGRAQLDAGDAVQGAADAAQKAGDEAVKAVEKVAVESEEAAEEVAADGDNKDASDKPTNPNPPGDFAGQSSFDEAVELRLRAKSIDDLDRVVRLCETAIGDGLDEENKTLAKETIAYTILFKSQQISRGLFDPRQRNRQGAALRQFIMRDLQKAIDIKGDIGQAHLLMAKLRILAPSERASAKEAADRAVELLTESDELLSDALVIRGRAEEDEQERLDDWNRAIELNKRNLDAWRTRGLYYLSKNETEKALADLQALLERDPKDVVAHQVVAEVLTRMKEYDKATEHLDKLIELNPNSATSYTLRARVKLASGDAKAALADVNQGLQIKPRNIGALLLRSNVHSQLGNQEAALADVDRAMEIDPDMLSALMQRSLIYYQQGKMPEAIADLRQLIRRNEKNVELHLQLATYYQVDQRPRKAIETYTRVLEIETDNLAALQGRADALLSIGKQAEAISDYEFILTKTPESSDVLNNLAWVLATSPEDNLRNGQRAVDLAKRACEATEYKRPHIISTLAASYAETGDFDMAVDWSSKALELTKAGEFAQQNLGDQLQAELDSYKEKKPWRERQELEDRVRSPQPQDDDLELTEPEDNQSEESEKTTKSN